MGEPPLREGGAPTRVLSPGPSHGCGGWSRPPIVFLLTMGLVTPGCSTDEVFVDLGMAHGNRRVVVSPLARIDGADQADARHFVSGWSEIELGEDDRWRWALGQEAVVSLEVSRLHDRPELVLDLKQVAPQQAIAVLVNGAPAGAITPHIADGTRTNVHVLQLAPELLRLGPNLIAFRFASRAIPPGGDNRALAAAFRWIELRADGQELLVEAGDHAPERVAHGFLRAEVSWFVFLPDDARLDFGIRPRNGAGQVKVVVAADGAPERVWEIGGSRAAGGYRRGRHRLDLSDVGGRYATVRFVVEAGERPRQVVRLIRPHIISRSGDDRLDVLLITLDALRYDRLGLSGYPHPTSPNIDALAQESIVFRAAIAPSSWTLPSLVSMMTGRHAGQLDFLPLGLRSDSSGARTLAEIFSANGYHTVGVTSHWFSSNRFGFGRGFDVFDDHGAAQPPFFRDSDAVVEKIHERWRDAPAGQPRLTWVHIFEPHWPYTPPVEHFAAARPDLVEAYRTGGAGREWLELPVREQMQYWPHARPRKELPAEWAALGAAAYDANIRRADLAVGRILHLAAHHFNPGRLVTVLTSDHGESLGEGGWYFTHGQHLHQELLHVPLLVRLPGQTRGRSRDVPVAVGGLTPTVVELAGVAEGPFSALWSINGFFDQTDRDEIVSELFNANDIHLLPAGDQLQYSVIADGLQTILFPRRARAIVEVRRLSSAERPALSEAEVSARRWAAVERIRALRLTTEGLGQSGLVQALSDEDEEALRALGYLR